MGPSHVGWSFEEMLEFLELQMFGQRYHLSRFYISIEASEDNTQTNRLRDGATRWASCVRGWALCGVDEGIESLCITVQSDGRRRVVFGLH